ncbi:hypothetical protein [Tardiphaga sp. 709]|jgi:hypothetical protein|uniref:hypothetical protein n=1 Tax=unclassified Tardiphaga TaxID=2631404 RepID=UPI0028E21E10|nr:hypothetical protein [Tardiphaga sp. 709]WNV12226.1 hypothetical protein RSO67_14200 [Tardiphaga sp. 709]
MLEFNTATGTILTMMTDNVVAASTILLPMSAGLIAPKMLFDGAVSMLLKERSGW